jgi:hypothetical protein
MTTVFVKPIDGAQIRDPMTLEFVPEEGRNVVLTTYWRKKIMQGVLEICEETPAETQQVEENNDGDFV